MRPHAHRALALAHLDVERSLRPSAISRSVACTEQVAPSSAAHVLTQISKPTVAFPSGSLGKASMAALRSIIAIMPGVEHAAPNGPTDVGEQAVLDGELVEALLADS